MPSRNFAQLLQIIFKILGGYLLAILVTIATTWILFSFRSFINPAIVALLYLIPVIFSTVVSGLWPGIATAFFAFLAFNYFFLPPYYTLFVHQTQDFLGLLVFLGVAIMISQLVGQTRQSLAEITSRELEVSRLYELTMELSGLQDNHSILNTLVRRTHDMFLADRVEAVIEAQNDNHPIIVSMPVRMEKTGSQTWQNDKPNLLLPLQSGQRLIGEIRFWRQDSPLSREEERLLKTFASQGAQALERARLAQAEAKAHILEESDRLKTSLLSSVSHELRTPLSTIKAAVTSLQGETIPWDSEARLDLLSAVEEESDHLNQLVSNLLNMSRIETGALKPDRKWNDISELIRDVIHRMRIKNHVIRIDIPKNLPLFPVDYIQMEQVFTNLLDNSSKYSPPGTMIHIQVKQKDENIALVQITNQGPHVSEENLERIFDKFYRITASDRITGTGLGLSICKGIIEAHGGKIWAENTKDGFAFKFTLPLNLIK